MNIFDDLIENYEFHKQMWEELNNPSWEEYYD